MLYVNTSAFQFTVNVSYSTMRYARYVLSYISHTKNKYFEKVSCYNCPSSL